MIFFSILYDCVQSGRRIVTDASDADRCGESVYMENGNVGVIDLLVEYM